MATGFTIVRRALKIAGVIDANEAPQAEEAADALEALNAMLAEWHEAEIGLPDYSIASGDTFAGDAADAEAVAYQLAERLAPEYGRELSPLTMKASGEAMSRLRLRYFQPGQVSFAELPSPYQGFDINTGE